MDQHEARDPTRHREGVDDNFRAATDLPDGQISLCKSEAWRICKALSRKIFCFRFS
jgi:hypothetical protein